MMGSSICLLPEKHFLCLLCRDIFTNPVTIPCGHSFCLSCLKQFWTQRQSKYCPDCRRLFANKPDLTVNHILADVSENYRKVRPQKPPDEETVHFSLSYTWISLKSQVYRDVKHICPSGCFCFVCYSYIFHDGFIH